MSRAQPSCETRTLMSRAQVGRCWSGAGEGNRTLVSRLEICSSTIELRPRGDPEATGVVNVMPLADPWILS